MRVIEKSIEFKQELYKPNDEKGKPAERRGRKAMGLLLVQQSKIARPPNVFPSF
jgi:hypothetical protein